MWKPFADIFGISRWAAIGTIVVFAAIIAAAVLLFFYLAPPKSITIITGPAGSAFYTNAVRYQKILRRDAGVELKIVPSAGSAENLERLSNPKSAIDVAFVQGGITNDVKSDDIVSLGSIAYEPLFVFYRGTATATLISDFKGRRIAVGSPGSGTRALALAVLKLNGIEAGGTNKFSDEAPEEAVTALLSNQVDVVFLTADSASTRLLRQLLLSPDVHLFNFIQADGYARRVGYLNRLDLPMGSLDFGLNVPKEDIHLIGPTVELLARRGLRASLCDLLLDAATEVHGGSGLFRKKGEFPALVARDYPISQEALRYQKSGKGFLYRQLPFWLASVVNRVLLVFVPLVLVLLPALKLIPSMLGWKTKLRLYRWYRALLLLEYDLRDEMTPEKRADFLKRLDAIEQTVNSARVPASFADPFYSLKGHIKFVKARLEADGK